MQAYIGGIVPMSTVDWPKNICTVVFFAGCDFKCPYCQNPKLVEFSEEFQKDLKEVKEEIKKSKSFIDAVLFSGGEACLQRSAILELAKFAKSLNLKTGVETNGSKPDVLLSLIRNDLIDFIGFDVKCPLNTDQFNKVTKSGTFFKDPKEVIENVRSSLKLLHAHREKLSFEIRTTIVPGLIYKVSDLLEIAKEIEFLDCTWMLQQFRSDFNDVLDPMLKKVKSPAKQDLQDIKRELLKECPKLKIEVKGI